MTFPFLSSEFCPGPLGDLLSLGLCGDHLQHPLLSDHSHGPEVEALSQGEAQEKGKFSSSPVPCGSGGGQLGEKKGGLPRVLDLPQALLHALEKGPLCASTPSFPSTIHGRCSASKLPHSVYGQRLGAPSCCDPEQFLRRKEGLRLDFSVAHPRL